MLERLALLTGEPWCFDSDQIARLTDWQILNLYLLPAVKRAEEFRRDHGSPDSAPVSASTGTTPYPARQAAEGPPGEPGSPEHRKAIIEQAFMPYMGLSREKAERLYDKQLAQHHAEQAARKG